MGMTHLPMFEKDCRLFAAITSFILTLLLGWDALVNSDGILYLTQAHLISDGAWRDALARYPWPAYATFIAGVHQLGFTFEHSAVIINGLCYALMVSGFVSVLQQAGGNRAIQWIGAIVLLVHPGVNGYREYIIRDAGLWGMLFWSLYALTRFHEKRQWRDVFLWTASISIAVLFRIEAMVFLLLAPLGLLCLSPRRSVSDLIQCQSLFIIAGLALVAWIFSSTHAPDLGRLQELPRYLAGLLDTGDRYMHRAEGLASVFSDEMKSKHAAIALFGAMLTYVIYFILKSLTPFYTLLAAVTGYQGLMPKSLAHRYLWVFILLSFFTIIAFFVQLYFLSGRYVIPLALLLMSFVPYAIHHIAVSRNQPTLLGRAFMFPLMVLIMTGMFIAGVTSFGYSKSYLKESGEWIHTHVKPNATLFVGEKHVAYYAKRFDALEILDHRTEAALKKGMNNHFQGKDIVVLYHEKKMTDINQYIEKQFPGKEKLLFENKRHDGITIIIVNPDALINPLKTTSLPPT